MVREKLGQIRSLVLIAIGVAIYTFGLSNLIWQMLLLKVGLRV